MNYSKEFKDGALKLSDEIGTKKAAKQLNYPAFLPPQNNKLLFCFNTLEYSCQRKNGDNNKKI